MCGLGGGIETAPSAFGESPVPAASLKKETRGGRFGFYPSDILEMAAGSS
jgi:hypothetical protein